MKRAIDHPMEDVVKDYHYGTSLTFLRELLDKIEHSVCDYLPLNVEEKHEEHYKDLKSNTFIEPWMDNEEVDIYMMINETLDTERIPL